MSEFTDLSGNVATITQHEYTRSRYHQFAGPVSELLMSNTRDKYTAMGATHWQIISENGATILRPVKIER